MSETPRSGIVYREYSSLIAGTPLASLWSYEAGPFDAERPIVRATADGDREYWLDRSDPLLNTVLPSTHVSVIVNCGDEWACGRSPVTSALLPRVCVMGPVTQARILRVGRSVRAVGAVIAPTLARQVFGVPPETLIDSIVPLQDLWGADDTERLLLQVSSSEPRSSVSVLKQRLIRTRCTIDGAERFAETASMIQRRAGCVSVEAIAKQERLSRQEFARRFRAATGFPPKVFARLSRFERLVHRLLVTDVADWASLSSDVGFYDQAHMINDFRHFAGSSPTVFFKPHDDDSASRAVRMRGRPSEWISLS